MERPTQSVRLRLMGNERYRAASGHQKATLVRAAVADALVLYKSALSASRSPVDRAAAAKNAGVCASRLMQLQHEAGGADPRAAGSLATAAKEACEFLMLARAAGALAGNSPEWAAQVERHTAETVSWALSATETWLASDAAGPLRTVVDALAHGPHASLPACAAALAPITLRLAEKLLHAAVLLVDAARAAEDDDGAAAELRAVQAGRPLLADAAPYLARARQLAAIAGAHDGDDDDDEREAAANELEQTLALHRAILDSKLELLRGEAQLAAAVRDAEEVSYEGVWAALDTFKAAVLAARERDLEGEAAALSRIGSIFADVLKKPERAHAAFRQSLDLALSAAPRSFAAKAWFAAAQAAVRERQERCAREDDAEKSRREDELLASKGAECEAIARADAQGAIALLRHVYEHHPPMRATDKLGSVAPDDLTKTLQSAVVHYHPDKHPKGGDPVAAALANFICKRLTAAYQRFK